MDLYTSLLLFFGGAMAHALFSKLLGINNKLRIYRIALINCLGITKYAADNACEILENVCESEKDRSLVSIAIQHWKNLSITSLKVSVPQEVWMSLGVKDWNDAERIVRAIEKIGEKNEPQ